MTATHGRSTARSTFVASWPVERSVLPVAGSLLRSEAPADDGPPRVAQPRRGDSALTKALDIYRSGSKYDNNDESPNEDRAVLLRYFERADAARLAGIVNPALFHTLIGPHALWWDAALWND